jgi:UDP-GlcNAc:undecaprenyl-phosphate GlcNAc-1-phosphate transferase
MLPTFAANIKPKNGVFSPFPVALDSAKPSSVRIGMEVGRVGLATVVLASAGAALLLTQLVATAASRFRILDNPSGYKAHREPTPLLGGIAVALATALGLGFALLTTGVSFDRGLQALAVGAAVILAAGLLDDVRNLSPRYKLAWQIGAAAAAGLALAFLGVRLGLFLTWPRLPMVLLTAVWVVGITNAFNLADNMNGLCAGLGAIAALALALLNLQTGEVGVAVAAAALGGSCLGFLPYNWPRARIFLGDTGSMFIGFLLAALSVMGVYTVGAAIPSLAIYSPLFLLAIPLFDALLVVILRLRVGQPPWIGDRRHISHRLVRRGMQPAAAVAVLWAAASACGLGALLLPTVGAAQAPILLGLLLLALGALAGAAGTKGLDD